jgi:ribose transport system ATP-binding protein
MARAVFGIDKPHSGTVTIKGKAMRALGEKPALRLLQGIGYLSEDRKGEGLALKLSIADNITITRYGACSRFGWLDQAKQRNLSSELMQALDVRAKSSEQSVQTLSGGNQQKVAIARLLHQEADILLLDEPTRGIDIGSKAIIYETIAELADRGKAIMLISSYLPELFGMCDRLAVMARGRLSTARAINEWTPELVLETAINSDTDNKNGH